MSCPNKNLPEYKRMVEVFGEDGAIRIFTIKGDYLSEGEIAEYEQLISFANKNNLNKSKNQLIQDISNLIASPAPSNKTSINNAIQIIASLKNLIDSQVYKLGKNPQYEEVKKILLNSEDDKNLGIVLESLQYGQERFEKYKEPILLASSFHKSLIALDYMANLLYKDLEEKLSIIESNPDIEYQDLLRDVSYYSYVFSEWKAMIKGTKTGEGLLSEFRDVSGISQLLGSINNTIEKANELTLKSNEVILTNILSPELTETRKNFNEYYTKEKERLESLLSSATTETTKAILEKKLQVLEEDKNSLNTTWESVLSYLQGKLSDINFISSRFVAAISYSDPIIFSFKSMIKKINDENNLKTQEKIRELEAKIKEIAKVAKELGFGNIKENPEDFYKNVIQLNTLLDEEGEEFKDFSYITPYKYEAFYDLQKLKNELKKLKEEDAPEQKILDKENEIDDFLSKYFYREYTKEIYDTYRLFKKDRIGNLARQEREKILDDIRLIQESTKDRELTDEDYLLLDKAWYKFRQLSSDRNEDGSEKTGDDKLIAERIKEYNEASKKYFKWEPIPNAFEKAKQRLYDNLTSQGIKEDSEEWNNAVKKWERNNTRKVIKQEYFEERKRLLYKLNELSNRSDNEDGKKLNQLYQDYYALLFATRDENNEVNPNLLSDEKLRALKNIEQKIKEQKRKVENFSGLTADESDKLSSLFDWIKRNKGTGRRLSLRDQELLEYLMTKRKKLSPELKKVFKELDELTIKQPTSYYINQFNTLSASSGLEIDEDQDYFEADDSSLLKAMEEPSFKDWFLENHYKDTIKDFETGEEYDVWRRYSFWTTSLPKDEEKYVTIEPSYTYSKRVVKDNYVTDKIEWKTVDNRGRWLPKTFDNQGRSLTDGKYVNPVYQTLKNSNSPTEKLFWNTLNVLTDIHLEAQENKPYDSRIGMSLPKAPKTTENITAKIFTNKTWEAMKRLPKELFEKIKNYFQVNENDVDNGVLNYKQKYVKTDIFNKEITVIPARFVGKMDYNQQSFDLPNIEIQFWKANNLRESFIKFFPVAQALEKVLEENSPLSETLESKVTRTKKTIYNAVTGKFEEIKKLEQVKAKSSNRLSAIRNIIDNDLKGEVNAFEIPIIDEFVAKFQALIGKLSLGWFDIFGGAKNFTTGNFMLFQSSIKEGYFTKGSLLEGIGIAATKFAPSIMKDYMEGNVSPTDYYHMLFNRYDPQQNRTDEIIRKLSETKKKDFIAFGWLMAPREYGELFLSLETLATMLNNKFVKQGSKNIRLIDAYEIVDGKLQLKPDVEFTKDQESFFKEQIREALQETQGNYAAIDKTSIERYVLGRAALFFRKFIIPNILFYYGSKRFNAFAKEGFAEGSFRTANPKLVARLLYYSLTDVIRAQKVGYWKTLSPREKSAFKHVSFISGAFLLQMLALYSKYGIDPDDEKEKYKKLSKEPYWYQSLIYYALSTTREMYGFTPFGILDEGISLAKGVFGVLPQKLSRIGYLVFYDFLFLEGLGGINEALEYGFDYDILNEIFNFDIEDKQYVSKQGGWREIYQDTYTINVLGESYDFTAGGRKSLIDFYKFIGLTGTLKNPAAAAKTISVLDRLQ